MILQIVSDAWGIFQYEDAMLLQKRRRAYAGKLKNMRRADRSRAENDFAGRLDDDGPFLPRQFDAGAAQCAVRILFNNDTLDVRARPYCQIGARFLNRP